MFPHRCREASGPYTCSHRSGVVATSSDHSRGAAGHSSSERRLRVDPGWPAVACPPLDRRAQPRQQRLYDRRYSVGGPPARTTTRTDAGSHRIDLIVAWAGNAVDRTYAERTSRRRDLADVGATHHTLAPVKGHDEGGMLEIVAANVLLGGSRAFRRHDVYGFGARRSASVATDSCILGGACLAPPGGVPTTWVAAPARCASTTQNVRRSSSTLRTARSLYGSDVSSPMPR